MKYLVRIGFPLMLLLIGGQVLFPPNTIFINAYGKENTKVESHETVGFNSVKLEKKAKEALDFCQKKGLRQDFCILVDMSIHSGLKRFFLWDFNKDTFFIACLVSHGCGDNEWYGDKTKEKPVFSNQDGSHCTSLGKYKIGKRGYSNWGINVNYLMYGFENSNNNALKRQIVFHSWEAVSEKEIYPKGIPEGWGCPAISNNSMIKIDSLLKNLSKGVLMWIFV